MIQLVCLILTFIHMASGSIWPRGRFGLPRPQTDCPAGGYWKKGWVLQDRKRSNTFVIGHSVNSHLKADITANTIKRYFCMKSENTGASNWPKGQYCVYMYFNVTGLVCPNGMTTGYIYWEDKRPPNGNRHSSDIGGIPSGVYLSNTRINYCCRTDGDKTQAIQLPTQRPFFLLAYNSILCQTVRWMEAWAEYIQFRRQDFMPVDFTGGTPPFLNTTYYLHYCYYKGCQRNENQTIGTIEAGIEESTSQSRYCSWLITSEANSSVFLNFSSFEFSGNSSLNFVNVYDGMNDNGALLGNFSVNSLPLQEELKTNSSWMFIVHRCFAEDNEFCRFRAEYNTIQHSAVTPTSMPGRHNYTNVSTSWSLPNEPSTNSKTSSTKSEGLSTKSEGLSTRSEGLSTKIEGLSTKTEWLSTKSEGLSTKPEGLSTRSEDLSAIPSEQTTVHTGRYSSSRNKMKAISLGTTLPLVIVFIAIIGYITYKKRSRKTTPDNLRIYFYGGNIDDSVKPLLTESESDEELLVVNNEAILRLNTDSEYSSSSGDQKTTIFVASTR